MYRGRKHVHTYARRLKHFKQDSVPPAGRSPAEPPGGADAGKHVYGTGKSKLACIGAEINIEMEEDLYFRF